VQRQLETTQTENLMLRKQLSQFLSQGPTSAPPSSLSPNRPPTAAISEPPRNTPYVTDLRRSASPKIGNSPGTSPRNSGNYTSPLSFAPPSHSLPPGASPVNPTAPPMSTHNSLETKYKVQEPAQPQFSNLGSTTHFGYTSPVSQQVPNQIASPPQRGGYNVTPVAQWPLPQGWDMSYDKNGRPYFINHANR
jgi:hypothetical protein